MYMGGSNKNENFYDVVNTLLSLRLVSSLYIANSTLRQKANQIKLN